MIKRNAVIDKLYDFKYRFRREDCIYDELKKSGIINKDNIEKEYP